MQAPPSCSTFEEFSSVSLVEAAKLLRKAEEANKGNVPKSTWSRI